MSFEPRVGCTVSTDGRVMFDLPLAAAAGQQLVLGLRAAKGRPERAHHVLALEAAEEGRVRAVLGTQPVLEEGRWDVFLLRDSHRQRLRPGLRDLRALLDSDRERPMPLAIRIPYVTKDGRLAIRAWLRSAHAEAGHFEVTDSSLTVSARLYGASLLPGAAVRLRRRGSDTLHAVEARTEADGRAFSFTVGFADLAAATGADGGVWDVFVQPAPNAPLVRVARLLDDVADRKEVFVYPSVPFESAELRPYYTVDNDLSVDVRRIG
ncbi:hypothetical protein [Streptomyces fagopyri]|uniref:hypothetical protein n=1 Tax=Streptomyces fagopyri TaxID=2662397 RepID=UPI003810C139